MLVYKCNKPGLLRTGDYFSNSYSGEIIISMKDYVVLYNRTNVSSNSSSGISRNLYVGKDAFDSKIEKLTYTFETNYKKLNNLTVLDQITLKTNFYYSENSKNLVQNSESSYKVLKVVLKNPEIVEHRDYFENLDYDSQFWATFKP